MEAEIFRRSLTDFVLAAWKQVEPRTPFISNWHIDFMCAHLEAVELGQITRLIINIPPRHMKSLLVSVFFPAWVWTRRPWIKFLCASYAEDLSLRDAAKARRLMNTEWYRERFSKSFTMTGDSNTKERYENNQSGHRISTSTGGMATGEGGDIIIVDDPHNVRKALSDAERKNVLDWWKLSMQTRLNNPETGAIIIIMQRVHGQDLAGYCLEESDDKYDHLCLPAEYEANRVKTALPLKDPRKKVGELIWPARYSEKRLAVYKAELGTWGYACQFQQRPSPLGGGLVKMKWFRRYTPPFDKSQFLQTVHVWDTAQKGDELINCPWVCGIWGLDYHYAYLLEVIREFWDYPTGKDEINRLYERDRPNLVIIEDKSTGSSLIQELDGHVPMLAFEPEMDKIARLAAETPAIEAGWVYLPTVAPWLYDFETEIMNTPNHPYIDQADMLSMFLKWWRESRIIYSGSFGVGKSLSSQGM